jgi:hypothetical protein
MMVIEIPSGILLETTKCYFNINFINIKGYDTNSLFDISSSPQQHFRRIPETLA